MWENLLVTETVSSPQMQHLLSVVAECFLFMSHPGRAFSGIDLLHGDLARLTTILQHAVANLVTSSNAFALHDVWLAASDASAISFMSLLF